MKYIVKRIYEYTNVYHVDANSAQEAEELSDDLDPCDTIDEQLIETIIEDVKVEVE